MVYAKFRATALIVTMASLVLTACVHGASQARSSPQPRFTTEEQKILGCLDLQDHIVDLYATEYVSREGVMLSSNERTAFRDGWAEELAKRGTFDRFEQSCFGSLTPGKYDCGMHSSTTGGLEECLRLSSRD
jgi:hypothetical protein